jgi:hypothetical protein
MAIGNADDIHLFNEKRRECDRVKGSHLGRGQV